MITSMALDSPKRAVVINSYTSKLVYPIPSQRFTPLISYTDNIQIKTEPCSQKKGRKRSLDHLSYEEKLQRKKLKNREAAQTSRDRKKARMEELEKTVKGIERINKELRSEVNVLRTEKEEIGKENEELRKENERLKEELRCARCTLESTPGSAVSTVYPLPQGRSSHPAHQVPPLALLVSLNSIISICFGISTALSLICLHWTNLCKNYHRCQSKSPQKAPQLPQSKWWGRHQHSWNPALLTYLLPITTT